MLRYYCRSGNHTVVTTAIVTAGQIFFGLDQKKFPLQGSIWIFCNSEARTDDTLTPGINVAPCCCCVRFTVHTPGSQLQPHTPSCQLLPLLVLPTPHPIPSFT